MEVELWKQILTCTVLVLVFVAFVKEWATPDLVAMDLEAFGKGKKDRRKLNQSANRFSAFAYLLFPSATALRNRA